MKYLPALLAFLLIAVSVLYTARPLHAARFANNLVRLDRMQANSPLSGLICATPSSAGAGTEAKIAITFPSDFTISSQTSNWTTGTSNLPSGSSAWPSIGNTASQISGQTVTFTSGNLTNNAQYCFTFTSTGSTSGAAGSHTGILQTRESDNTLIDQNHYGMTLTTNDRVTLTATVPANANDFNVTLTKLTHDNTFSEWQEIGYLIQYGSNLSYDTTISLEASWSLGSIGDSETPSVEILDYVIGSADKAYNNTQPVVDLINRKITWEIPPTFPGGLQNQEVRFKLRTTDTYRGTIPVKFAVSARVLGPGIATPYSTSTSYYVYSPFFVAPPAQSGTSSPSTPNPTTVPTPTSIPAQTRFSGISIDQVSADEAHISVSLTRPASMSIMYGTDPTRLTQRIVSLDMTQRHTLRLTNLTADMPYYFRITATDETGRSISTDTFTFTTAKISKPPHAALDSLVATSENTILFTPLLRNKIGGQNILVVPTNTVFETQFGIQSEADIKDIVLLVRDKNVLGINNIVGEVFAASDSVPMLEIKPDVFTGRLKSKPEPGEYEIYAKMRDYNNNIVEEKIADLRVSMPMMILQKTTRKPIENARISLSLYNEKTRIYEYVSPNMLPIQNPVYSEPDGRVPLVLPLGIYRAEVTELRNEKQIIDFTIGPNPGENYPTIYLANAPFSILRTAQHLLSVCVDVTHASVDYLRRLGTSGRFLELNALIILGSFIILSLFALSSRLRVPIRHLPSYFAHQLTLHPLTKAQKILIEGRVIDHDTGDAVKDADIFILDRASGDILLHTASNTKGSFSFPVLPVFTYTMEIARPEYHPGRFHIHESHAGQERVFSLTKHNEALSLKHAILSFTESLLGMSFEVLLLLSLVLSGILGLTFGFLEVLPFLTLALVNLILWLLHRNNHELKIMN